MQVMNIRDLAMLDSDTQIRRCECLHNGRVRDDLCAL